MVSRQETARPLLTPGEVMQLPTSDEIVMVSGVPPIRAKKVRYYEDTAFQRRVLSPPSLGPSGGGAYGDRPKPGCSDDWTGFMSAPRAVPSSNASQPKPVAGFSEDQDEDADGGVRREPELPEHEDIAPEPKAPAAEFAVADDEANDDPVRARALRQRFRGAARQAAMDPDDGLLPPL